MSERPIVVGVDSLAGSTAAVFWAADEARLRRRSLLVVHTPAPVPAEPAAGVGTERLLTAHATAASARQPRVPVTTLLGPGEPGDTLVDLSRAAAMVVIGLHSPYAMRTGVPGRVTAHAHCPVVAIPEGRIFRPARAAVTVLATGSAADPSALAVAAEEAELRDLPLTIVDVTPERPGAGAILALGSARTSLVVVPVDRADRHDDHLDPVVAGLLAHAACPVMVVGKPDRTVVPVQPSGLGSLAGTR
jgi:hypothetical protein